MDLQVPLDDQGLFWNARVREPSSVPLTESFGAWFCNDSEEARGLAWTFEGRPFPFCMGNVCFKAKGARLGESGAVAHGPDLALRSAVDSTHGQATSSGGDKVLATSMAVLVPLRESPYFSTRIEGMIASMSKGKFESELEFETGHSKVHWSELSHRKGASCIGKLVVDHRQSFEALQKDVHWGSFCSQVDDVVLGRKLGEGAQADIYEAKVLFRDAAPLMHMGNYVVKVMKGECALEDLQRQWPRGMANVNYKNSDGSLSLLKMCGALVKDPATKMSKFGFVMPKYWGDLRKLIDLRMIRKNAKGPPFNPGLVEHPILRIAMAMSDLHKKGITHRDLKAANVLVSMMGVLVDEIDMWIDHGLGFSWPHVADWECSVGIVGTGFWRAPEILQHLKNGFPSSELVFNEKSDIYSFAMTCYEIVTGLVPFEGLPVYETRDAILDHELRPQLPHDLSPKISAMITSCWHQDPSRRPSFWDIIIDVQEMNGIKTYMPWM